MRPVSTAFPVSQPFGSMKTAGVAPSWTPGTVGWYVRLYGNYQPYGHAGLDIACPEGTPVRAIAAGTVLWADWGTNLPGDETTFGYRRRWYLYKGFPGIVTVIQHAGWIGVYAHLSAAHMNTGDRVTEAQVIGLSGGTGGVAPHLHVEALVDLTYRSTGGLIYGRTDPEPYFGSAAIAPQGATTTTTQASKEDELSAAFEADARGEFDGLRLFQADVRGELDKLRALDADIRGDLANKGTQITALTATVNTLAGMVGSEQGLDAEQIKQAVTEAIAAGITVTVSAG